MKRIKRVLLFITLIILPINIYAATGSIKASTSTTNITLNNTFTVTVKVSSSSKLGSWQFGINYDKTKLSLISGDQRIVAYGDGSITSKTYTYKFKAIAKGTAKISVEDTRLIDWDTESNISVSNNSLSINIKEPVVVNYSSDNNLSSLSIDEFEISPSFEKNTLEYSVTTLPTTTKIKINASANDNKAKVSGIGEFEVQEGINEFNVVVTAENGSIKTYTIKVTVPEKNPIIYNFANGEYTILRKLPENIPSGFSNSTITFNEEELPCLQNEILGLTLIYIRDNNNKESFYIYNSAKNEIILYNEVGSEDFKIYTTNKELNIPNLAKTTIKINENPTEAYQLTKNSTYYIISGINISTGKEGYYLYETTNKTISIFSENDYEELTSNNDIYKFISASLGVCVIILLIITITINNSKNKLAKALMKPEQKEKTTEDKTSKDKKKETKTKEKQTKENSSKEEETKIID